MQFGAVITEGDRLVNLDPSSRSAWTSTDGLTWQRMPGELTESFLVTGLGTMPVHWKDGYISIAGGCGEVHESAAVWESSELVAWRRGASLPKLGLPCVNPVGDIVTFDGRLLAAAMLARGAVESSSYDTRPVVWSSGDGRNWGAQPLLPWSRTGAGSDVSLFTAHGAVYFIHYRTQLGGAVAWRSTNATTWTRYTTNLRDTLPHSVVSGGPGFVAILNGVSPSIATSADARTWRTVAEGPSADDQVTGLFVAGTRIVAIGSKFNADETRSPVVWISSDGLGWQLAATLGRTSDTSDMITMYRGHLIWFGVDGAYVSPPVAGEDIVSTP